MAINYNAGFLPQGLYNNIGNALQRGYDADLQRRRDLATGLGTMLGAYGKMTVDRGNKAQEQLTKQYEQRRKDLQEQMKTVDPRDSQTIQAFNNQLSDLDSSYNSAIKEFSGSGFLGTALGRDTDALRLNEGFIPQVMPEATKKAMEQRDALDLYEGKKKVDQVMDPVLAGATRTAQLTADAKFSQSDLGKAILDDKDTRDMKLLKQKTAIEVEAYILKNGGTTRDVQVELQKLRSATNPQELAERLKFQQQEFDNRMKVLNRESELDLQRIEAQNAATMGQIDARNDGKTGADPYKYFNALDKAMKSVKDIQYPNAPPGSITPEIQKDIRKQAEANLMKLGIYPPEYKSPTNTEEDPSDAPASTPRTPEKATAPVAAPSAADLGFTPRPGQGFVSQDFLNNLDVQTTDLGNRVERLQNDSGKPMFPDLQKRADQLMVRAEQAYKEMGAAKTPEQQKTVRQKLNTISKEIFQVSKELDKKEMDSGSFRGMLRRLAS